MNFKKPTIYKDVPITMSDSAVSNAILEPGEYKRALRDAHDKIDTLQSEVTKIKHDFDMLALGVGAVEQQRDEAQAEVAQLKEALGWRKVDTSRENWPLSFNKMRFSQAFMEDLVEMMKEEATERERTNQLVSTALMQSEAEIVRLKAAYSKKHDQAVLNALEVARLREAIGKALLSNSEGINALCRGFAGDADSDFRESQKIMHAAIDGISVPTMPGEKK